MFITLQGGFYLGTVGQSHCAAHRLGGNGQQFNRRNEQRRHHDCLHGKSSESLSHIIYILSYIVCRGTKLRL